MNPEINSSIPPNWEAVRASLPTVEATEPVEEIPVIVVPAPAVPAVGGLRGILERRRQAHAERPEANAAIGAIADSADAEPVASRTSVPIPHKSAKVPMSKQSMSTFRTNHRGNTARMRALALQMGYGDNVTDRSAQKEQVAQSSLGFKAKRRHNHAARKHTSLTAKADRLSRTEPYERKSEASAESQPKHFNIGLQEHFHQQNLNELYRQINLEVRKRMAKYRIDQRIEAGKPLSSGVIREIKDEVHAELISDYTGLKQVPVSHKARIERELEYIANPALREADRQAAEQAAREEAIRTGSLAALTEERLKPENLQKLKAVIKTAVTDAAHAIKDSLGYGPDEKLRLEQFDSVTQSISREAMARYLGTEAVSDEVYELIDSLLKRLPKPARQSNESNRERAGSNPKPRREASRVKPRDEEAARRAVEENARRTALDL